VAAIPKFLTPSLVTLKVAVKSGTTLPKEEVASELTIRLNQRRSYSTISFVESSVRKNIYDGLAVLDDNGAAVVDLPRWFQEINSDFCYQLTPIGAPIPSLHIAEEINENRFKIAGGSLGMKVSWQVTGIRKDRWAKAHPMRVEEEKGASFQGRYLHAELYGQPEEESILPHILSCR